MDDYVKTMIYVYIFVIFCKNAFVMLFKTFVSACFDTKLK